MRRNELRDWLSMPPDPEMDEIFLLENYLPVNLLGYQKKLKGYMAKLNGKGEGGDDNDGTNGHAD